MRIIWIFPLLMAGCYSTPPSRYSVLPYQDFRGIIHCHSKYSHDSKGTYEEILAAAKAAKVDFICMTDHPPSDDKAFPLRHGWRGLHDGVLFIQGAEYSDQILGLGLKEPITGKDRRETIKAIHEQGGVAIACHPEEIDDWDAYAEADGMEIYNVHATLKRKSKDKAWMLETAKQIKENPENSFKSLQELDPEILKRWDAINQKRPFTGIAGNDAHQNVSFFGLQLDPYPRAFKFVTTHVIAHALTQEAILEAIKAGRCYVRFSEDQVRTEPGPGFEWIGQQAEVGTWFLRPGLKAAEGAPPIKRRWLRDGKDVEPEREKTATGISGETSEVGAWAVKEPGSYRFEALWESGAPVLITNPVRFVPRTP
jgi:hypothetical protein